LLFSATFSVGWAAIDALHAVTAVATPGFAAAADAAEDADDAAAADDVELAAGAAALVVAA
jgi:hypothetical protein